MIRILAIVCMMFLAHGQASAEMAKANPKPKPVKQVVVSGCTFLGLEGCYFLGLGKERVPLTADPGVVIPPPRNYIIARGKFMDVELGYCGAKRRFHASHIVWTRRACPPAK